MKNSTTLQKIIDDMVALGLQVSQDSRGYMRVRDNVTNKESGQQLVLRMGQWELK